MKAQLWRRHGAFRCLVGGSLALLALNLLSLLDSGRWGDLHVTVVLAVVISGVTVLRLLLAYWDTKDEAQTNDRTAAGPASDAQQEWR